MYLAQRKQSKSMCTYTRIYGRWRPSPYGRLCQSSNPQWYGTGTTKEYRELHNLQNSDEIKGIKNELKREQAATVSVVEPKGKRRRKGVVTTFSFEKIKCDGPVTTPRARENYLDLMKWVDFTGCSVARPLLWPTSLECLADIYNPFLIQN